MEPKDSLPNSQVPATCPYLEPAGSSPYLPHSTSWRSILILSSHLSLGLSSGLFTSGSLTETLYITLFSPISATCPVYLILDFITCTVLAEVYVVYTSFPVTRVWRVLRLGMEERPPLWRVAANTLNNQSRTADRGCSFSLEVGRGVDNSWPWRLVFLRSLNTFLAPGLILWYDLSNGKKKWRIYMPEQIGVRQENQNCHRLWH